WAHHGMVTIGPDDKMAKSVGNVLDVKRAVDLHGRNAVRMWLLQSHYSQPIEYSGEILEEKRRAWRRLTRLWERLLTSENSSDLSNQLSTTLKESFDAAMHEDLNTSEAIAAIFEVLGRAGQEIAARPEAAYEFRSLAEEVTEALVILGFVSRERQILYTEARVFRTLDAEQGIRIRYQGDPDEDKLSRAVEREKARREKDWATADRLRDELSADGWVVEDTPEGPILSPR
ncbi:MAG: class I tRNA ligase family protein, partial [Actinomycetota bacterium]|nr:class I tRNA ligase family protein [Actinomycetota bacterium]